MPGVHEKKLLFLRLFVKIQRFEGWLVLFNQCGEIALISDPVFRNGLSSGMGGNLSWLAVFRPECAIVSLAGLGIDLFDKNQPPILSAISRLHNSLFI